MKETQQATGTRYRYIPDRKCMDNTKFITMLLSSKVEFRKNSLLTILLLQAFVASTTGTPDGAGGCAGGMPAVGGFHLSQGQKIERTLEQAGLIVKLGGTTLSQTQTALVAANVQYEIRVESPLRDFIGILIRVEAPVGVDTTGSLTPSTNTHIASICGPAPVVGITHFSKDPKSFANGTLIFGNNYKGVIVDLTVVYQVRGINDNAYGRFLLDYFGSPTSAPVIPPPTTRPSLRPTIAPTNRVTSAPVLAPKSPPTPKPRTMKPTRKPSRTPRAKKPTSKPTPKPRARKPTRKPTRKPRTRKPTSKPTRKLQPRKPSSKPTRKPTRK